MNQHVLDFAHQWGRDGRDEGLAMMDCPYNSTDIKLRAYWIRGWVERDLELKIGTDGLGEVRHGAT